MCQLTAIASSCRWKNRLIGGAFFSLALCFCAGGLRAQPTTSISGTTVDGRTGIPVVGAAITIPVLSRSTTSDRTGKFVHAALEAGPYEVQVHAVGYTPASKSFQVSEGQAVVYTFVLTAIAPPDLPKVLVTARGPSVGSRFDDFDRRRASKRGQFMTRSEIEARNAMSISDLLQSMRGLRFDCVGFTCSVEAARSAHGCAPAYFVDGRLSTTFGPSTPVRDIQGIEVYLGPSETPAEYLGPDSGCGAIGIWTKSSP